MLSFIAKRLAYFALTLFLLFTVTFVLMKSIPGDPFTQEQALPQEILKNLHTHYGLDKPIIHQYFSYLKSTLTLNFGPSFKYEGMTVNQLIEEGFPISATLGLEAFCIAVVLGILIGVFSAINHSRWQDKSSMVLAVILVSVPGYVLASILQYFLAYRLGIFPVAMWGTFSQSILPAISLAALPMAFIARLVRNNMIEVLHQDFIKTAKAKGLSHGRIVWVHAFKNSLLPIMPYFGTLLTNLLVGSFVVEKIYGIPGLGQWFISSVLNRDYTVIMGITLFYGTLLLAMMCLIDIINGILDPRIRKETYS
jgi:oligopeptide transport system permease protein